MIWDVHQPVLRSALFGLSMAGWVIVLYATFLIDHFDLFGLRQVYLYLRGIEYHHPPFAKPTLYKVIRHPLYAGWITAFWATPTMTITHLVFALGMTAYILVAIPLEERNLVTYHGKSYADYRRTVPMLIPGGFPPLAVGAAGGASVPHCTSQLAAGFEFQ